MQEHNLFREYLGKVCEQIRWKKAHPVVLRELGDHLEDEQTILIESGIAEDEAASKAILDMGDAALVGSQLDRAYRPRPAWGVISVTAALMIIGFFARLYIVEHVNSIHVTDIPRSLFWLCAAIIMMIAGYFLDYTILGKHPLIIGAGFVAILISARFTGGEMIYNVRYYSEYLMILIPVIYAGILWWWPYKGYRSLIVCYLLLLIPIIAHGRMLYHNFVPVCLYCGVGGLMLTVAVLKGRFGVRKPLALLILYSPVILIFTWMLKYIPSSLKRIFMLYNLELEPEGMGYVAAQILNILKGAKWIGAGSYPTENLYSIVNDHMLTYFIQKFGWISLVIVLLLFGSLFVFSGVLAMKQKSQLGRIAALAILLSLATESVLYILNNLGRISFAFTVLPLLSYGNAALLVDSFLIGLMLSVFRNDDVVRDPIIAPKRIPRIKITMERLP